MVDIVQRTDHELACGIGAMVDGEKTGQLFGMAKGNV